MPVSNYKSHRTMWGEMQVSRKTLLYTVIQGGRERTNCIGISKTTVGTWIASRVPAGRKIGEEGT